MKETKEEWSEIKEDSGFWNPQEEGQMLEGTYKCTRTGKYGDMYDIENDGEILTTGTWSILNRKMKEVLQGKLVRIVYTGDIKTQNGTAKNFDVFVKENDS